jgi:hypothetical protein
MDHFRAIELQAAERYFLGDLPPGEIEEFEQHFFECTECAADVESAGMLVAGVRSALAEAPAALNPPQGETAPPVSWWERVLAFWRRPAFLAPVAAALACVAVYQGAVVIPSLRVYEQARALPAFQLTGAVRGAPGEANAITVPRAATAVALSMDLPNDRPAPLYRCTLLDAAGRALLSIDAAAPPNGNPLVLLLPAGKLSHASYRLDVSALRSAQAEGGRIASYVFQVQFE